MDYDCNDCSNCKQTRKCKKLSCLSIVLGIIGFLFSFSLGLLIGATVLLSTLVANTIPFILLTTILFILFIILFVFKMCYCE